MENLYIENSNNKTMVNLVVRTSIKELIHEEGLKSMSNDFMDNLDEKVKEVVKEACKRAKANSRRTVMARDI